MQAQNLEELKRLVLKVLPEIIKEDPVIKAYIKDLLKDSFAEKDKTEDRIEKLYEELVRLREDSEKRWQEYLEDRERVWAELERQREESNRRWEQYIQERDKMWAELERRREEERQERERMWAEMERRREEDKKEKESIWAELERQREESERKWEEYKKALEEQREILMQHSKILEEHSKAIQFLMEEVKRLSRKHDSTIGALGACWGLHSEESFRNALKGILEESFPVKVERYINYDKEGIVFGRPDQIELDLIIKNGEIIVAEIKSSMSKADVYAFLRKLDFYQSKEGVKVSRAIIISPMVDPKAKDVALKNGIEVYSYAEDVEGL
ncbi:DUF3782 domain-containing protein [Pampinifervens florentissimum]|uniref:DUF3782 domain-containing protein n=1 Tax=Pampinifervens florentissimum TaxID=1632019 RepID=UPI0013B479E3|nr:DUF3782 domain-containing protein [Hydrogenobacter sp. T-8]QID32483.1 DUF3782 domain-containing protein [Hydrogenobacter sp. T-8]